MLLISTGHILAAGQEETAKEPSQDTAASSQIDSIDISLLTCQPHDEVYSLYGHTAIRVVNHRTGDDWAVNWGVFDPTTKFFVLKFVFGLTDYMMGIYRFSDFLAEYRHFGSGIYQQHLNLSREEKTAFMKALALNAQPENVVYRYNYFYDNCTTRARDMILTAKEGDVDYKPLTHLQRGDISFRDLIHYNNIEHPWARLGNDLLLGVEADLNTDHNEREFLPEVLAEDFDSATVTALDGSQHALVDSAYWVLLPGTPYHPDNGTLGEIADALSPTLCALIFICVILALCILERFMLRRRLQWAHFILALPYGITGLILTAMIFSQHPTVNLNLQILIANPLIFWFTFPEIRRKGIVSPRWAYRWHAILVLCILFFIGNFMQSYAEGMNIMALALSLSAIENIVPIRAK